MCFIARRNRYPDVPIVVVETAYPFEPYENAWNFTEQNADFAFTPAGQAEYLSSLIKLAKDTFGAGELPEHPDKTISWTIISR